MNLIVEYKGKTLNTKFHKEIDDEKFNELKNEYYQVPDLELIKKEIKNLFYKDRVMMTKINKYFFKDLMQKVRLHHSYWSIEDVWNYKPLFETFYGKVEQNKKVFVEKKEIDRIKTQFRLGGKGVASKPTNYPLKSVLYVLDKYNVNDNYYDFSCGWGVRLMGSIIKNINYFGTDPNYILVDRLNDLYKLSKEVLSEDLKMECDIKTKGSEVFIPEWENKIGLQFSSPPYFCLEDYKIGKQSYIEDLSYDKWKETYLVPTFKNVNKYLIKDGYILVNIKNFRKWNLYDDSFKIIKDIGFNFVEEISLNQTKRVKSNRNGKVDNSEKIMVFRK